MYLLRIIDELGSRAISVRHSLTVLAHCLRATRFPAFIPVARAFIPEIQTVLFLSFDEKSGFLRDRIHNLTRAIIDLLLYHIPLSDEPELPRSPPATKASPRPSDEEFELPFDPRARKRGATVVSKRAPQVQAIPPPAAPISFSLLPAVPMPDTLKPDFLEEIIRPTISVQEIKPEAPAPPPDPPAPVSTPRTEEDWLTVNDPRMISNLQLDDFIESC
jgi:hypothetical protein